VFKNAQSETVVVVLDLRRLTCLSRVLVLVLQLKAHRYAHTHWGGLNGSATSLTG